jgi:hypothetical protein
VTACSPSNWLAYLVAAAAVVAVFNAFFPGSQGYDVAGLVAIASAAFGTAALLLRARGRLPRAWLHVCVVGGSAGVGAGIHFTAGVPNAAFDALSVGCALRLLLLLAPCGGAARRRHRHLLRGPDRPGPAAVLARCALGDDRHDDRAGGMVRRCPEGPAGREPRPARVAGGNRRADRTGEPPRLDDAGRRRDQPRVAERRPAGCRGHRPRQLQGVQGRARPRSASRGGRRGRPSSTRSRSPISPSTTPSEPAARTPPRSLPVGRHERRRSPDAACCYAIGSACQPRPSLRTRRSCARSGRTR